MLKESSIHSHTHLLEAAPATLAEGDLSGLIQRGGEGRDIRALGRRDKEEEVVIAAG